ncbi:MAG: S8 family serine peptidase [Bdellovibrionales bacterium]|jgi:cell wall-associated protease|nr:S8 family serine peptidase [Bdellovibrionales bacterium]MBT3527210.1 S8 family serine peptidase [Bdellovibrionales bacterium]MBT7670011.1 S8 family serine peptidase [Bdellovibrionales bacterium]MBT7766578.1 S8 family serine peptidase [Bdellovibrionales bacterium]
MRKLAISNLLISITMLTLVLTTTIKAETTVAVIDSGTDIQHQDIANNVWFNQDEIADNNRDEDRNGYQDDVNGWNFAESNNQIIDYSYLGTFDQDVTRFFILQAKILEGTHTEDELNWMREKIKDQAFIKQLQVFGNFIHGTHVAGITVDNNPAAKVLSVKLMPTEVKLPGQSLITAQEDKGVIRTLVKKALGALAKAQMQMMVEVATYVGDHGARVANGSFGTGYTVAEGMVKTIYKKIMRKDPPAELVRDYALHFISTLLAEGKKMMAAAPNTLFVFAAGNEANDNDLNPGSPANIVADNLISVAASYHGEKLGSFSNYGANTVHIAAPGVVISSAMPGEGHIILSGTSQAAPMVSNVATSIVDANPNLTPKEVKEILMGTVDLKEFLQGKVKSGGTLNGERALHAAALTKSMEITQAISAARTQVADLVTQKGVGTPYRNAHHFVLPLISNFR